MKKLVVILCGVIWASEAVAVTQIIPAGEDVSGGDVHTVVTQQVLWYDQKFYRFRQSADYVRRRVL